MIIPIISPQERTKRIAILIMGYTDAEPSKEHLKRRRLEEYVSYR